MIHILLEGYNIDEPWLAESLKDILRPEHRVAVFGFAFSDREFQSGTDFDRMLSRENGSLYGLIARPFAAYGIPEDHLTFLNYFSDSTETMRRIIREADVLYFLGGLPDRMMERIYAYGLYDEIAGHTGILMGYSAGAVIQLREYHLSPDEDYDAFGYYEGLPFLKDFYLEVHYTGSDVQKTSIRKVLSERMKPVYATRFCAGALLVRDGEIRPVGDVELFQPESNV